jgi:hypothetical protein
VTLHSELIVSRFQGVIVEIGQKLPDEIKVPMTIA